MFSGGQRRGPAQLLARLPVQMPGSERQCLPCPSSAAFWSLLTGHEGERGKQAEMMSLDACTEDYVKHSSRRIGLHVAMGALPALNHKLVDGSRAAWRWR